MRAEAWGAEGVAVEGGVGEGREAAGVADQVDSNSRGIFRTPLCNRGPTVVVVGEATQGLSGVGLVPLSITVAAVLISMAFPLTISFQLSPEAFLLMVAHRRLVTTQDIHARTLLSPCALPMHHTRKGHHPEWAAGGGVACIAGR